MFRTLFFEPDTSSASTQTPQTRFSHGTTDCLLLLADSADRPPSASLASDQSEPRAPEEAVGRAGCRRRRVPVACAPCRTRKKRCSGKPPEGREDTRCDGCILADEEPLSCDFRMPGISHPKSRSKREPRAPEGWQQLHGSLTESAEQGQQGDGNADPGWRLSELSDVSGAYPSSPSFLRRIILPCDILTSNDR